MPTNTAARRAELYSLLGPLPPRAEPVECRLLWTEEHDGWVREELRLITAGRDLPATLTRPASVSKVIGVTLAAHRAFDQRA